MKLGEALVEHGLNLLVQVLHYWFSRSWCWSRGCFWSLVSSVARNPNESVYNLFKNALLGFALTEAVGLLALMNFFCLWLF
jgi:hypothetical protein